MGTTWGLKVYFSILRKTATSVAVAMSMAVSASAAIDPHTWHQYANEVQPCLVELEKIASGKRQEAITALRNIDIYPYAEVPEILIERIETELKELEKVRKEDDVPQESVGLITLILNKLSRLGAAKHANHLDRVFETFTHVVHERIPRTLSLFHEKALASAKQMEKRSSNSLRPLPRAKDLLSFGRKTGDTPKEHLQFMRDYMNAKVLGQPELVEAFLAIEQRRAIFNKRDKPEIIYMMGPPGTGKDTSAQAYVDALYGKDKAYQQHMFPFPVLRKEGDSWAVFGSATGYVGSDFFPPFLKFLVEHSGGRYRLEPVRADSGTSFKIVKNSDWKGENLPGFLPPESAVVFVNEFHNWSKALKDAVIKQALEKGIFKVNNPRGGESEIYVPVTFAIASNEGIGLVTSRELNGERFGKPLSYDDMVKKWEQYHNDKQALKEEIQKTNGRINSQAGQELPGISEELLDRVPLSQLILLRPHSPDSLKKIANFQLKDLNDRFKSARGNYGAVTIEWSQNILDFVQNYHYVAEENARPIEDRVRSLVMAPLLNAFSDEVIKPDGVNKTIGIDIQLKADGTSELVIQVKSEAQKAEHRIAIESTRFDKKREPISDARIEELLQMPAAINQNVVGASAISDRVMKAILVSEEGARSIRSAEDATDAARTFMFLGPSSVGKSEFAKELAKALYGRVDALYTSDWSQVQTVEDVKKRILGSRDRDNNPIPSDFMKQFDRNQGRLVVNLDEIANAGGMYGLQNTRTILKTLYDIFREPVVRVFSDGKERIMSGVTFTLTGNTGEEWYQGIPTDIPDDMRRAAMEEIYTEMMADPQARRASLELNFSEALLNRIGERNIFFFSPLTFKATHQLMQLKINQAVERLKAKEGRRGWNVFFTDPTAYKKLIDVMEREAFIIKEQGASIDRFSKQEFEQDLRALLLTKKVPSGSQVVISFKERRVVEDQNHLSRTGELVLNVKTEIGDLEMVIKGKQEKIYASQIVYDQIQTAAHEVGHEQVRKFFFDKTTEARFIKIIPGVTQIGDKWIVYLGLASREEKKRLAMDREHVLRQMAVLFGGEVAQSLITKGDKADAGKRNDMERATLYAENAVIRWGLSKKWGSSVISKSEMSDTQRDLLKSEVDQLMAEARELARTALLTNYSALIEMTNELAKKGEMHRSDFEKFYGARRFATEQTVGWTDRFQSWMGQAFKARLEAVIPRKTGPLGEFIDGISMPKYEDVAVIENIIEQKRRTQIDGLPVSADASLLSKSSTDSKGLGGLSCASALR